MERQGIKNELSSVELFAPLGPEHRRELSRIIEVRNLKKDSFLFEEGKQAEGAFMVLSGVVRLFGYQNSNRGSQLYVARCGEVLAEERLLSSGVYPYYAQAVSASRVLYIPREKFWHVLHRHPQIALAIMLRLYEETKRSNAIIKTLSLTQVKVRVAKYLMDRMYRQGARKFRLDMKKRELAARLATTNETLSRTLCRLQKDGIIAMHNRTVEIRDSKALVEIMCGKKRRS